MADKGLRVRGLQDLQRAFALADKEEAKELRNTLKDAAEPVRSTAEGLTRSAIKVGKIPWSGMRIGVTQKSVYVAPTARRTVGSPRKKFAKLLLDRGMLPALSAEEDQVEKAVDQMLADIGKKWERA